MNLLVYGSLRKGMGNNGYFLGTSKYLGKAMVDGFQMFSLGAFPYVRPNVKSTYSLVVDIYDIDDKTFKNIDMLEGYPSFYNRKEATTTDGVTGWIYFIDRPGEEEVLSGDWVRPTGGHMRVNMV